jgi:hypothetical protein
LGQAVAFNWRYTAARISILCMAVLAGLGLLEAAHQSVVGAAEDRKKVAGLRVVQ